jgi:hypothetical protein
VDDSRPSCDGTAVTPPESPSRLDNPGKDLGSYASHQVSAWKVGSLSTVDPIEIHPDKDSCFKLNVVGPGSWLRVIREGLSMSIGINAAFCIIQTI